MFSIDKPAVRSYSNKNSGLAVIGAAPERNLRLKLSAYVAILTKPPEGFPVNKIKAKEVIMSDIEVTTPAQEQIGEYFKDREIQPIRIFLNEGG